MIEGMVDKYIGILISKETISAENKEAYKYHMLCFLESFIVIASMLVLGFFFKEFVNVSIFIICFFSIRNRSGGFHLNTFWKCFAGTICLECIIILLVRFVSDIVYVIDFLALVSFLVMMIVGALNHPNMDYSRDEYIEVKKISRIVTCIVYFMIVFLKLLCASEKTILFMEYAIILPAILMVLGCITKQHKCCDN